jgi:hypothetical protein
MLRKMGTSIRNYQQKGQILLDRLFICYYIYFNNFFDQVLPWPPALKGFKDVLPGESEKWAFLEQTARKVFQNYGYAEIKTPILEKTELFARTIVAATDIVEKEMYTFADRSGDSVTLRPEATASVLRAFIEHHLHAQQPLQKLFSLGMFPLRAPEPPAPVHRSASARSKPLPTPRSSCSQSNSKSMDSRHPSAFEFLGCPTCRPSFQAPSFSRSRSFCGLPTPDQTNPCGSSLQGGTLPGISATGAGIPVSLPACRYFQTTRTCGPGRPDQLVPGCRGLVITAGPPRSRRVHLGPRTPWPAGEV